MKIAVTFGQRFNRAGTGDIHPASPEIQGNSFVVFEGDDYMGARAAAIAALGTAWAFDYVYDDDFQQQIRDYGLVEVVLP